MIQENSNKHCYKLEYREYYQGILDSYVDTTYIITMTNSIRMKNIETQLKKYIPTKKIYIVKNDGYKKCNKILSKYEPPYDLTDTYFYIMQHSLIENFNNILILEDDFIFSDNINNMSIHSEISNIFKQNKNNKIYFNLGPMPILFYPNINVMNNVYNGIFILTSQAIIYNKNIRYDIMNYYHNIHYKNWDVFISLKYKSYFYRKPLCYQTFPQTENQKYWLSNNDTSLYSQITNYIIIKFFSLLGLDKTPEPGYTYIYTLFFIINYLLLIIIIFCVYIFLNNLKIDL